MTTATALGFGGRAPTIVLEVLAKTIAQWGFTDIIPQRSQSVGHALLSPPHRVFLQNSVDATESRNSTVFDLLLYCLPSSVTEYLKFYNETNIVRSALLDPTSSVVVVMYDPLTNSLVGFGKMTTDLTLTLNAALAGDKSARNSLAAVALTALAHLDQIVVSKYWANPQQQQGDIVIVVGSGGREHALAVTLAQSPLVGKVICCPGNGGTAQEGGKISNVGASQDNSTVIKIVQDVGAHMVVVGPEAPLVDGLVDDLAIQCPNVLVFGPRKAAAELEASKAFSKDFLQEHGIPTAKYRNFTDVAEAVAYVESLDENDRQVVKASGLAAGKGVLLPTTKEETIAAVKEVMSDKAFGAAGDVCVIESYLTGPEASCLAFCDGITAVLMPAAQDHKRALDNDQGLNTGGMGAYSPAPCVTPTLQREIEAMCIKTVQKMAERGTPYVGVLFAGMMLTPTGPQVLEFNCRFGDPETQVVLPLLETDLYEVLTACCIGKLDTVDVRFKENVSAATVVCAAKGYPEAYPKGMTIEGLEEAKLFEKVKVYHAGTTLDEQGVTRCFGGRVLAVTGIGSNLNDALQYAYRGVSKINFVGPNNESLIHYRSDIAKRAIEKKLRIGVLGSTRGTSLIPVIDACASGGLHAEIVAVVSNKSSAPILDKGRALGPTVLTRFISAKGLSREQYDAECTASLVDAGVEFVLLVGYMRILSKPFTDYWKGRCINVHPSLLPKHAGGMDLAVHQAVIDAGEEETGCTIHQVTEAVDGGPIIVQKRVKVKPDDTAESLKAKVQELEGKAFIEAIEMHCQRDIVSYASAGVSIDAGNELVELIKPACKATRRPGCDADLGGFGGLFDLAAAGYDASSTVLIGATDGVGTKLRIAHATGKHETVGIDLVAMCVNDLIVAGGEPLFFLDYYATGHLEVKEAAAVVRGIAEGCRQAGCGLIGGETAEMPSMYAPGDYDLAGFSVGAVHREKILPQGVSEGDVVLGIPSSGIHSNGFSLVRRLVEKEGLDYAGPCPWDAGAASLSDALLTPTKIYVRSCLPLIKDGLVKGMAHITGGGLVENLPRSLPPGIGALIKYHPQLPPVFNWIKRTSGLDDGEMLRTFNCGVGMVLLVDASSVEKVKTLLALNGEPLVFELGVLVKEQGVKVVASLV